MISGSHAGDLDAMSHQAADLGRYREAADLARAAGLGTASSGAPILTAHFHAMEARALARLGDTTGWDRAMTWISYFDDAELAAEPGRCHRDLTWIGRTGLRPNRRIRLE